MRMTRKQFYILDLLIKGEETGFFLDIDELVEKLESEHKWCTTKQSLQFSIRALVKHLAIEKQALELRRGRFRVSYTSTDFGKKLLGKIHSGAVAPKKESRFS